MTASHSLALSTADATLGRAAARRLFGPFTPANGRTTSLGNMTGATRKRVNPFDRSFGASGQ